MLVMTDTGQAGRRVASALQVLRSKKPMTQEELGDAVGESQSWISRRESGEVESTPSEVGRIETALGLRPGTVYREAGLLPEVGPTASARRAIETDPFLSADARRALLGGYDAAVSGLRSRRKRTRDDVEDRS